jgi:hypothetical protein
LPQPRRKLPATPPGTAAAEEKPLPEYLSILQRSDCRKAGATGGNQVKTITIHLPDVEAAMLVELGKANKKFKDPGQILVEMLRVAHGDMRQYNNDH